jgi:cytoskeletal protein CcmA (bactofilin family)
MITTIGRGIRIKGTVQAEEAIVIAGTIVGDVIAANHDVTLEAGGHVDGAITGRRIVVRGQSKGRLIAREIVRVLRTAAIKADIASPKLALEEGATFTGSVEPGRVDAAMIVQAYRNNKAEQAATPVAG